jgi:bifunctional ADP-heptose synthase (sugar kinase/adenylyltransferase)
MFDSNQTDNSLGTAADVRDYLVQLNAERALASLEGLDRNAIYLADLDEALAEAQNAYVLAAVTEIASLRAELFGADLG